MENACRLSVSVAAALMPDAHVGYLDQRGVKLISAGWDEVPMVYKNIEEVMAAQTDLLEPLAKFFPRLVKMAPAGEKSED